MSEINFWGSQKKTYHCCDLLLSSIVMDRTVGTFLMILFVSTIHQSCSWSLCPHWTRVLSKRKIHRLMPNFLLMDDLDPINSNQDDFAFPDIGEADDESPTDDEVESMLGQWDERVAKFNSLHLVGRVGNSPEPRYFDDGNVVVNLNLACRRKLHYTERQTEGIKSGEEETDWYALEIWGQTAEFVSKYVQKGARVGVVGSLQVDDWQDKETGEKRCKAKCIVQDLEILESKAEADLRKSNQRGSSFFTNDDDDDDDEYDPSRARAGGFFDS